MEKVNVKYYFTKLIYTKWYVYNNIVLLLLKQYNSIVNIIYIEYKTARGNRPRANLCINSRFNVICYTAVGYRILVAYHVQLAALNM